MSNFGPLDLRSFRRRARAAAAAAAAAIAVVVASAAPAFAQEFVKVNDNAREQLPATPFVGAAYGFIWVALLAYLFFVARGLGRLKGEIDDLRRRVDRSSGGSDAR